MLEWSKNEPAAVRLSLSPFVFTNGERVGVRGGREHSC
jgi:hypothetical protein